MWLGHTSKMLLTTYDAWNQKHMEVYYTYRIRILTQRLSALLGRHSCGWWMFKLHWSNRICSVPIPSVSRTSSYQSKLCLSYYSSCFIFSHESNPQEGRKVTYTYTYHILDSSITFYLFWGAPFHSKPSKKRRENRNPYIIPHGIHVCHIW